jgi:hypothetical protein
VILTGGVSAPAVLVLGCLGGSVSGAALMISAVAFADYVGFVVIELTMGMSITGITGRVNRNRAGKKQNG